MEMTAFTESMFIPLMIQKESFDEHAIVAFNQEGIMNLGKWIEDDSGLCYIPDIIKIELTFDGNINDIETFDPVKAEIFSIVATRPKSFVDDVELLTDDQNTNMLKNIINCFSGDVMKLPKELILGEDLMRDAWSYRVAVDQRIYPCVVNGDLVFECI